MCVFVFQMFAESIIDSMQLLDQDTAVLCSYTLVLHSKCRQISQDAESGPILGCSNCLYVNVYYVRREALRACASTCV